MRLALVLAAVALSACEEGLPTQGEAPPSREAPAENPYRLAPDGSLFRHTRLAKLKAIELVVGGADPGERLPVVVMLHGLADAPRLPSPGTRHRLGKARVFLPRAPYVFERGFAWYPHRMSEGDLEAMRVALEGTAHHLALFLDAVAARHDPPCAPVLAGFSQGAMATLAAAILRPASMSEAFVGAGFVPPALLPSRAPDAAVPIRMLHGLDDPIVPPEPTAEIARELERRGFEVELRLFEGAAHAMSAEMDETLAGWWARALSRCVAP